MDGFDDLLAPSRAALEQNPFADPFAPRSESPDPWASYARGSVSQLPDETAAFADVRSATPTLDSPGFSVAAGTAGFHSFEDHQDPLESQRANEPEEEEQNHLAPIEMQVETSAPRSPGFRESVPSSIDETLPTPSSERRPSPPPVVSPPASTAPSSKAPSPPLSPTEPTAPHSTFNDSTRPAAPTFEPPIPRQPASQRPFFSPLDQPYSIQHSFAGLSLGGETQNDWQGSQSMFATPTKPQPPVDDDDDDDDDKPILQAKMSLSERVVGSSAASSPPATKTTANGIAPVFTITVDDPQRVGDPIRGYTLYTVHTKTTSPLFSKSSFSVLRRYSDFLWLYETLSNNNPGVVVPPVPEKSPFNRFDASFLQQRRLALEKCIQKIANHPVLQKDSDLKLFLESDTFSLDIKHRKAEIAHEKGGLMATIGQTIAGPKFYETDEWFDKQKSYLDSLELQLRGLVKAIDSISKQRTELALVAGEFSAAVADLSTSEVGLGSQLANSLAGLASVEKKVQEMQDKQANEDQMTLMSTADEYARLISSVRLAFSSRVRMYHAWQNADANAKRVKQTHESNRAQGKLPTDQLSRSLALVADAERRALDAKQEFDHTSKLVKSEVARFEQERIADFKSSLEAYLDGMIVKQKDLISAWEAYQQTLLDKVKPLGRRQPTSEAAE